MADALHEITKTLVETILIVGIVVFLFMGSVRTALVPLVAMPVSLIGAAIVMYAFGFSLNLLTMLAIVLSVGPGGGRRDRGGGERRAPRAGGEDPDPGRAGRRPRAGGSHHRDDDHAGRGVHADRLPGRPDRLALPGVRHHAGGRGRGVGHRRGDAVAGHELAVRARAWPRGPAHPAGQPRFRRGAPRATRGCWTARWACGGAIVAAALLVMLAAWPLYKYSRRELAPVEDQSHISLFMQASPDASLAATNRSSLEGGQGDPSFPEAKFMWSLTADWGGFGGMVTKNWKERAALDRADVWPGVRRGLADPRAARVSPAGPAAADAGAVRRGAGAGKRRAAGADAADGRAAWWAPAGRAASSCTSTPTSRSTFRRHAS